MKRVTPPCLAVDTAALCDNYRLLACRARQKDPSVGLWCVVKADAYGHGLRQVTEALSRAGAGRFAVATLGEAEAVRSVAPTAEVLILGVTPPQEVGRIWRGNFCQSLHTTAYAAALSAAFCAFARERSSAGESASDISPLRTALKLDCGMGRLGFPAGEGETLRPPSAEEMRGLAVGQIYAHFSAADDPASHETERRLSNFHTAVRTLRREARFARAESHICASAGLIRFGSAECDAARCGLALYGYSPSAAVSLPSLRPVMTLTAPLIQVRRVPAGTPVGYGGRWRAPRAVNLGILPLGYADGLLRGCSGASVLYAGHRVPIVGAVSMDLCAVCLGDLPGEVGDRVTLIDRAGKLLPKMAEQAGTSVYELLCRLGENCPSDPDRKQKKYIHTPKASFASRTGFSTRHTFDDSVSG